MSMKHVPFQTRHTWYVAADMFPPCVMPYTTLARHHTRSFVVVINAAVDEAGNSSLNTRNERLDSNAAI